MNSETAGTRVSLPQVPNIHARGLKIPYQAPSQELPEEMGAH